MDWALDKIGSAANSLPSDEGLLTAVGVSTVVRRGKKPPLRSYAIRLNELIIHNNRTWFSEGDIRLDALVVHGNASQPDAANFYHVSTFSCSSLAISAPANTQVGYLDIKDSVAQI